MNKIHLYATMLALSCGAALFAAAQPANAPSAPWHSLLREDSAPDWRGWKEPGLPAGWYVAGRALSQAGAGAYLASRESPGKFAAGRGWGGAMARNPAALSPSAPARHPLSSSPPTSP